MSKGTPACGRPNTSPWRNRFLCVAALLGGKGHAPHSEGDVKVSQPRPLAQQGGVGNGLAPATRNWQVLPLCFQPTGKGSVGSSNLCRKTPKRVQAWRVQFNDDNCRKWSDF